MDVKLNEVDDSLVGTVFGGTAICLALMVISTQVEMRVFPGSLYVHRIGSAMNFTAIAVFAAVAINQLVRSWKKL